MRILNQQDTGFVNSNEIILLRIKINFQYLSRVKYKFSSVFSKQILVVYLQNIEFSYFQGPFTTELRCLTLMVNNHSKTGAAIHELLQSLVPCGSFSYSVQFMQVLSLGFQIKSVKTGSLYWSVFTALSYFYMVSVVISNYLCYQI